MCDFFWLSPADLGDLSDVVRESLQPPPPHHHRLPAATPASSAICSSGSHHLPEEEALLLLQARLNFGGDDHDEARSQLQSEQQLVHGSSGMVEFMLGSNGSGGCACDHAAALCPHHHPEGLIPQPTSGPQQQLCASTRSSFVERRDDDAPVLQEHVLDMAMAPHRPHSSAVKRRFDHILFNYFIIALRYVHIDALRTCARCLVGRARRRRWCASPRRWRRHRGWAGGRARAARWCRRTCGRGGSTGRSRSRGRRTRGGTTAAAAPRPAPRASRWSAAALTLPCSSSPTPPTTTTPGLRSATRSPARPGRPPRPPRRPGAIMVTTIDIIPPRLPFQIRHRPPTVTPATSPSPTMQRRQVPSLAPVSIASCSSRRWSTWIIPSPRRTLLLTMTWASACLRTWTAPSTFCAPPISIQKSSNSRPLLSSWRSCRRKKARSCCWVPIPSASASWTGLALHLESEREQQMTVVNK
jgi:hypothetical protein